MAPKRKTKNDSAKLVVTAVTGTELLPADLRSLLAKVLPAILETDKADRHPFQTQVVQQVQEAFSTMEQSLSTAHSDALATQSTIASPGERSKREAGVKEAEEKQKQARGYVETCDASKKETDNNLHDAEHALKVANAAEHEAEKVLQKFAKKKTTLEGALTDGFTSLKEGTFGTKAQQDSTVKLLVALGTEYGVGGTCLQAFTLASKAQAGGRSEFEIATLDTVKARLDVAFAETCKQLEDETAAFESKKAETIAVKEKLIAAQEAQKAAIGNLIAAKAALKEAQNEHSQAVSFRRNIWTEIKTRCDEQDELAQAIKRLKEVVYPAFEEVKEKVSAVEEVTSVEEPPEKKQKMDEEASRTVEGETPVSQETAD